MITLTRRTVHTIRAVFRRVFSMNRETGPSLVFNGGPRGVCIQARRADSAIEFRQGNEPEPRQFTLPFKALDAVGAKNDDSVTFQLRDGRVIVQWQDGAVPKTTQYDQPEMPEGFPALPAEMAKNPPGLLQALKDASATTDPGSLRYALGCIQLRSDRGRIVASDGRQLLVQSGFTFPWPDDILIPANKVFGSPCLPTDQTTYVGSSQDWFNMIVGPWTLHLRLNQDGRFPRVEDHIRDAGTALSTLRLADQDADFFTDTIHRLPGDEAENAPVTVDLNGQIAIRAASDDRTHLTEVVLSNSSREGAAVRFNTNRRFLTRATKLGFRNIELAGPETPAHCRDETRVYAWALLGQGDRVKADTPTTRIESPVAAKATVRSAAIPSKRSPIPTMSEHKTSANGNGRNNVACDSAPDPTTELDNGSPVERAEALRDSLKVSLARTRDLIQSLKRQKKQSRIVESTLASLRQLQTVDL